MQSSIIQVREAFVISFIVYDNNHTVIIDTGFIQGIKKLEKALSKINRSIEDIDAIILTHGHLDHTFNLHEIKRRSGALVAASPKERLHIEGKYPYKGISKICGGLEALGRGVLGYTSAPIDIEIEDYQTLDFCGGLKAIPLPGHTIGQLGFIHLPTKILFSADLVDFRTTHTRTSPAFLNTCPQFFPSTIQRVLDLDLNGIYSNHTIPLSAEQQLKRFKKFGDKYLAKKRVSN